MEVAIFLEVSGQESGLWRRIFDVWDVLESFGRRDHELAVDVWERDEDVDR